MGFRGRREVSTATLPDRVRMDGKTSAAPDEASLKARVAKGTAYDKYKAQLHEFFDGKRELPQNLKDMLATRPGAEDFGFEKVDEEPPPAPAAKGKSKKKKAAAAGPSSRRRIAGGGSKKAELEKALKAAVSPVQTEKAVNELRDAGFALPADFDVLSRVLSHPDDDVLREALQGLLGLVDGPATKSKNLLKGRIQNVELTTGSSEVRDLCAQLKGALG